MTKQRVVMGIIVILFGIGISILYWQQRIIAAKSIENRKLMLAILEHVKTPKLSQKQIDR